MNRLLLMLNILLIVMLALTFRQGTRIARVELDITRIEQETIEQRNEYENLLEWLETNERLGGHEKNAD